MILAVQDVENRSLAGLPSRSHENISGPIDFAEFFASLAWKTGQHYHRMLRALIKAVSLVFLLQIIHMQLSERSDLIRCYNPKQK